MSICQIKSQQSFHKVLSFYIHKLIKKNFFEKRKKKNENQFLITSQRNKLKSKNI